MIRAKIEGLNLTSLPEKFAHKGHVKTTGITGHRQAWRQVGFFVTCIENCAAEGVQMYKPDNWLDVTNYPDTKIGKVSMGVWVWEFVRRNAEYRADFDTLVRPHWELIETLKNYWDKFDPLADSYEGTRLLNAYNETPMGQDRECRFLNYWRFASSDMSVPLIAPPERRSEFIVAHNTYQSPASFSGIRPDFVFCFSGQLPAELERDESLGPNEDEHMAWVKIDFRRPIPAQIRNIKVWSSCQQKRRLKVGMKIPKAPKPRIERHAMYLRILDATESGVTHSEIARVLFPGKSSRYIDREGTKDVENALGKARTLRDIGWRELLAW